MRLLTVESVLTQLNVQSTSKVDEIVRGSILMASAHLESYLKTSFVQGETTDVYYVSGKDKTRDKRIQSFILSKAFVASSPALTFEIEGKVLGDTEYLLHTGTGKLVTLKGPHRGSITATYTYGFPFVVDASLKGAGDLIPADPADLPQALLQAAMILSSMYYRLSAECKDEQDCYLKSFGRAAMLLDAYDRRLCHGFLPL